MFRLSAICCTCPPRCTPEVRSNATWVEQARALALQRTQLAAGSQAGGVKDKGILERIRILEHLEAPLLRARRRDPAR